MTRLALHRVAATLALLGAALAVALLARPAGSTAAAPRTAAPRTAAVGQGFVGVDVDGPLIVDGSKIQLSNQLTQMVSAGVQNIRIAFNWAAAEPWAHWSQMPKADRGEYADVHGVPVDFSTTDAIVAAAARKHVSVLPTVLYAPSWDAVDNKAGVDYPRRVDPYAAYLTALIGRYGPHGSFWSAHRSVPRRPVREWQVWNEENLTYYWHQPFAAGYAKLLHAAYAAAHRADPGSKVVLGALTNRAWASLTQLHAADPSAMHAFDIAAVNGFTEEPANVIVYLRYMRNALARLGDPTTPLLATEVSWPSALGHGKRIYSFETTEAGQARNIATLLPLLGADAATLRLAGFDYYTWMGAEGGGGSPFDYAGLLADRGGTVHAKPALAAFRRGALALEHCRSLGPLATDCRR